LVAAVDGVDMEKNVKVLQQDDEKLELQPRALHKTQSIFLRNLPALITRQEIEQVGVLIFAALHCNYFSVIYV